MDQQTTSDVRVKVRTLLPPRKAAAILMLMVVVQWAVYSLVYWNSVDAVQDDPFEVFIFPLVFVLPGLFLLFIRTPISWMAFSALLFAIAIPLYVAGLEQIFMYLFDGRHWTLFTKAAASSLPLLGLMVVLSQMRSLRHFYHVRTKLARLSLMISIGVGLIFIYVILF